MAEQTDVVVIGLGPGGERLAGALAEAGLHVVGIESKLVGGECPYWGCIPSKMMIRAAGLIQETRRVPGVAGSSSVQPDWTPVATRIREQATTDWDDQAAVERLEDRGVRVLRGRGRIEARGRVRVGQTVVEARRGIVVAAGTSPTIPPIPGIDDVGYWTNHDAVEATELPTSIVVLGAGAVGSELAQVMARFGVSVTLAEALDRVLPGEEPEASAIVADVFAGEGIEVHTGARATSVRQEGDQVVVALEDGAEVSAERLLVAVGRRTDLQGLGVASTGLDDTRPFLEVDERLRAADGIWAVGDVTGQGLFTHLALHQADIAVRDILGEETPPARYDAVPRVTFTDPEVGSVGLTEARAHERGLDVVTATKPVPHTARGWIHGPGNDGVIKLVADRGRHVLVGATSVGPNGGEVLGLLSLAVHAAVPLDVLDRMIFAYPTFHRGVADALAELDLGA